MQKPSPFPCRPLQEQRFFARPQQVKCDTRGALLRDAQQPQWVGCANGVHCCVEHRCVSFDACIELDKTLDGPCSCFVVAEGTLETVSVRGFHKCMYCGYEDSSLAPCVFCGQVVCQLHPLSKGTNRCRCWTSSETYFHWQKAMESRRMEALGGQVTRAAAYVSIGGYLKEDWFCQEPLPEELSATPHLIVVEAMRLSPVCRRLLHPALEASEGDSWLRLTDIALRMREDNFQIVGDMVYSTDKVMPRGIRRAPGERREEWSVEWHQRYMDLAPFATHFGSHRLRWGGHHDSPSCDIGDPPFLLDNEMVALGTTVRPWIGSECDHLLWNTSTCHVCDVYEGLHHLRIIEPLSQYYYGLACVPACVEKYWVRTGITIRLTCDASGSDHHTVAVILVPLEGPDDHQFARREYVVVVHALYFRDSGRAEAAAQTIAQLIGFRCERLGLHVAIWNDHRSQALETYTEHCATSVRRTPPWNMMRRCSVRTNWCQFTQASFRLPPVGALSRDQQPEADSWARGPLARRGTNRMPQSCVRWKTCRWCLWEQRTSLPSYKASYEIPEPLGCAPSLRRFPQSFIAVPRARNPEDPTCVADAVQAAVIVASADCDRGRPVAAALVDCKCWVDDARHYTLVFNRLQGRIGVDNAHPAMVCLNSAVKLAEVIISFECWDDHGLVPVMQMGAFHETTLFFRVVCFLGDGFGSASDPQQPTAPRFLHCV